MTGTEFISLFQYVCNIFWSFFIIVYRIPVTTNVSFGEILIIALVFFLVLYFIMRPYKR